LYRILEQPEDTLVTLEGGARKAGGLIGPAYSSRKRTRAAAALRASKGEEESVDGGEDRSDKVGKDRSVGICRRSDGDSADSFEKTGPAKIAGEGVEESGGERFVKDAEIRSIDFVLDRVRVGETGIELGQLKGLASCIRRDYRCD
jgi:hypothetical protein